MSSGFDRRLKDKMNRGKSRVVKSKAEIMENNFKSKNANKRKAGKLLESERDQSHESDHSVKSIQSNLSRASGLSARMYNKGVSSIEIGDKGEDGLSKRLK